MWLPLCSDPDLINLIAECWVRPVASGYLPRTYREDLAGGRLIALSKRPKPGLRPIWIGDAIRRIIGRGLHCRAQKAFNAFFQTSSANVLQFGGDTPNGATNMYHLLSAVHAQAEAHPIPESNVSLDPIAILSALADSINAFNAITSGQILSTLLKGTDALVTLPDPSQLQAEKDPGWDFLWPFISAHYCYHGKLEFYYSLAVATSLLSLLRLESLFSKVTL
jgi:hypothetical protein